MKWSIVIIRFAFAFQIAFSAGDSIAQGRQFPIPKPITGAEQSYFNSGTPEPDISRVYHNTYKDLSLPGASVSYTVLPGVFTIYDLQSNGVVQQIWQNPLSPAFIHAVVMYSTVPGFATRSCAYFFSFDYGLSWNYITDVPSGNFRSGFPSISGFVNGNAVIACHDNSQSTVYSNLYYDIIPGAGLFTRLVPGIPASQGLPIWPMVTTLPDNTIFFAASVNGLIESYTNKATNISPPGMFSGYQLYNGDQAGGYAVGTAPNGSIGHAYIGSDVAEPNDVFYRSSADGGLTFSNPVKIWDWNLNTDSIGCLRGVSLVFDNNNQPFVAFNTSKLNESGFFPEEPSQIRVWSPGVNGGIPKVIADSSNVPFFPNTGSITDAFLPLCKPSVGRSSSSSSIIVAFSASTQYFGTDSSRYFCAYVSHSSNAGVSWNLPQRITPESPLRDWRYISVSPTSHQSSNNLTVQMLCQSDSIPGSYVNGAPLGRGEFVSIRYLASTSPAPAPPALLQPLNGSYILHGPILLDWSNVSNAVTYSVQLSSDSLFANLIVNENDLSESRFVIDTLLIDYNSKYFWRARAVNTFGSSDWSYPWKFITYPMLPLVPVLISPENGAINISATPSLRWSTIPNSLSYSVQIAREPAFITPVYEKDSLLLPEHTVPASVLSHDSVYYWRVRGKNQFGFGAFSQPWSFTVVAELPAAPQLLSPANDTTVYTNVVTFAWLVSPGAASYTVQVSSDSLFSDSVIYVTNITSRKYTSRAGVLSYNSTYYWRMRGTNLNGNGAWSGSRRFSTTSASPPPVLLSPANGQAGVGLTVLLDWSNSVNAVSYDLMLATDSLFQNVIADVRSLGVSQYSVPSPLLTYFTRYFWKARTNNSIGSSDWSATWSFRTLQIGAPGTPVLQLPANGALNVSTMPNLRWTVPANTSHYRLNVSVDSTFGIVTYIKDTILPPEFILPDSALAFNTNYYWRVQAVNYNQSGNWSSVFRFRTAAYGSGLPGKPVLESPANNSNNVSAVALLNWGNTMLADRYDLNVSTDVNFSNTVLSTDTITISQYKLQPGTLNHNTLYFWKVRSLNANGAGKWSEVFAFRTALLTQLENVNGSVPAEFMLFGNYPNPFNPLTKFRFDVPRESFVEIAVYDINGRIVSTVINELIQAGSYEASFDASAFASGVYFCRMNASGYSSAVRILLLK